MYYKFKKVEYKKADDAEGLSLREQEAEQWTKQDCDQATLAVNYGGWGEWIDR